MVRMYGSCALLCLLAGCAREARVTQAVAQDQDSVFKNLSLSEIRSFDTDEKPLTVNKWYSPVHDASPLLDVPLQEAKVSDLPIPFNAKLVPQYCQTTSSHDRMVLGYRVGMGNHEAADFYRQEMERCGWQLVADARAHESQLIFRKPSKLCVISVRSEKKGKRVLIVMNTNRVQKAAG